MKTNGKNLQKILVIKLGALGDFIQALGPMAAIRRHHPRASITLLTTKPFSTFAEECGYFDQVWIDKKPRLPHIADWINLRKQLNGGNFDRVYDLQNNDRTSFYFRLFNSAKKPEWVGVARGASHRNARKSRTAGHAFDGHAQTLKGAGVENITVDTLEWMKADITAFPLKRPFVLLVPGCAPERPEKRWPANKYGQLAHTLQKGGVQPVIVGTAAERTAMDTISTFCPEALDLIDKTSFNHIAALAREAVGAIGNDTGPMHMVGATGCPSLVLFSAHSNPVKHAPKGASVKVLQKEPLGDLSVEDVLKSFSPRTSDLPSEEQFSYRTWWK